MIRRFLPAVAALGLLPALMAAGSAIAGTTGSPTSGAAVAAGTVTAASGAAMPGVVVDLYAWPSDAVVSALTPGSQVPMTLLTTATTDSAGAYTLRVPESRLAAAATEDGWANLEIDSRGGGLWFLSYPAGKQAGQPAATVTVNLGSSKKHGHPWPCGYSSKGVPYGAIGPTFLRPRAPVWATVGQGYILPSRHTRGDWVNFNYTEGSTHTQASHLGLGLSAYGLNAGYDHYGTHTSTATHTEGFTNSSRNAWFQTEFKSGQFRFLCVASIPGQPVHRVRQHAPCPRNFVGSIPGAKPIPVHMCLWMVQSMGHFGGTQTIHPKHAPATPAGNCAPHEGGPQSHYDGDYGTAVQWSSGWDLGADLHLKAVDIHVSFNASAQTGYDTNAVMYFHFARRSYLCGTNGSETSAAQLVVRGNLP